MLNEHIAATSIYYYDVENTTESRIRFRQEAELDYGEISYARSSAPTRFAMNPPCKNSVAPPLLKAVF
ncbi:hypothetical protein BU26DRAFT_585245 [Trematosphaeria pertusa]|uniref:DUF4246 domain-containing protein n=1 Tax=Trematosphaeria pertusa TaxID=390896 RepID=A0A6A6HVE9_9PLEO|nr:uncharacterized protein BU26DRAFT_585245 [Trematosphaeria pertusa]KAF2241738.1 hypothetical protein BU26DRAFT_585245 [Trematosphaeria pertusa]